MDIVSTLALERKQLIARVRELEAEVERLKKLIGYLGLTVLQDNSEAARALLRDFGVRIDIVGGVPVAVTINGP